MQRSSATCRPLRYPTPRASETSGVEDDVDRLMMIHDDDDDDDDDDDT